MTGTNGTPPRHFGRGDAIEVTEGTIVASLAVVAMYVVHRTVELPIEIEGAAAVLVYAAVRAAVRWLRNTQVFDLPDNGGE